MAVKIISTRFIIQEKFLKFLIMQKKISNIKNGDHSLSSIKCLKMINKRA